MGAATKLILLISHFRQKTLICNFFLKINRSFSKTKCRLEKQKKNFLISLISQFHCSSTYIKLRRAKLIDLKNRIWKRNSLPLKTKSINIHLKMDFSFQT